MKISKERANLGRRLTHRWHLSLIWLMYFASTLNFRFGFRNTWDDVNVNQSVLGGPEEAAEFAWDAAVSQGRIGHLIQGVIGYFPSLFAEEMWMRTLLLIAYFSIAPLLAKYVEKLFKVKIMYLVLLVTIAFQPVAFDHMAPNSFPAFITIPFFALLLSRLISVYLGAGGALVAFAKAAIASISLVMGLSSEYAAIFFISLLVLEAAAYLRNSNLQHQDWSQKAKQMTRRFRLEIATCILMASTYLIFRTAHPSTYEGNQVAAQSEPIRVLAVMVGHPFWGFSIPRLVAESSAHPKLLEESLGSGRWLGVLVWAVLFFAASLKLLSSSPVFLNRTPSNATVTLLMVFLTLIAVTPVALVKKYQDWCTISSCGYLDSRIEFLLLTIACSTGLVSGLQFLRNSKGKRIWSLIVASTLAICAAGTLLLNISVAARMRMVDSIYANAKASVCLSEDELGGLSTPALIDPISKIASTDIGGYWDTYRNFHQTARDVDCESENRNLSLLRGRVSVALDSGIINFGSQKRRPLLNEGWWSTEPWGIWAMNLEPKLVVPANAEATRIDITSQYFHLGSKGVPTVMRVNVCGSNVGFVTFTEARVPQLDSFDVPASCRESARITWPVTFNIRAEKVFSPNELDPNSSDTRPLTVSLISIDVR